MISFVPLAVFGSVCNGADLSAVDVEASRVACEVTAAGVRLDLSIKILQEPSFSLETDDFGATSRGSARTWHTLQKSWRPALGQV